MAKLQRLIGRINSPVESPEDGPEDGLEDNLEYKRDWLYAQEIMLISDPNQSG